MDPKALQLFQEVSSKAHAGRIRWEPTVDESRFVAAIGGEFTITVSESEQENSYGGMDLTYALVLKDKARELLRVTNDLDGVYAADLRDLYETARRQALRVDEKLDKILGDLGKL